MSVRSEAGIQPEGRDRAAWAADPAALDSSARAEMRTARLLSEMAGAWARGERPQAEVFLAREPELNSAPGTAIPFIYEELCLRREAGEQVALAELTERFPQWRAELEVLLDCDRLLEATTAAPDWPVVGESLGGFRLLSVLGRGAQGRCFLAAQPALADRRVVLKVTPNDHAEHRSLGCMQHTHIVPLYSVQEFEERNLRVLCMPYFGGTTLEQLLDAVDDAPPNQRSGAALLDWLARGQPEPPASASAGASPVREFFARTSYVRAICWIGCCLADALHYAHGRGLVHLDVKPSNILLAADGQPFLLDFHLARAPVHAGAAAPEGLGGTRGYMAPEQAAAIAAVGAGRPIPTTVDERADLFSLGRTLAEALGGSVVRDRRGSTCTFPREVDASLGDVIAKCVALDPADRYPDAAALADDLRRHMADLPLRGVGNRSLSERWRKWRRRRPTAYWRLKTSLTLGGAFLVVASLVWTLFLTPRFEAATLALRNGTFLLRRREYGEAARELARGAALIEGLPGGRTLTDELAVQTRRAAAAQDAERFHELVERLRFVAAAVARTPEETRRLEPHCRSLWETRRAICERVDGVLDAESSHRFRLDMIELAVLASRLRVRTAVATGSADAAAAAQREVVRDLTEVEARFGPSPLVARERQAQSHGGRPHAAVLGPQTAADFDALGRQHLESGDWESAQQAFERAIALRPQDFWPHFNRGVCAYRRRRFTEAVDAFQVCIALTPDRAEPYYNRSLAYAARGDAAAALADRERAARLDPRFGPSNAPRPPGAD